MNLDFIAPDQPSPEAPPLTEEEPPLPVTETLPDYPPGVERRSYAPLKRLAAKASAQAAPKKKKRGPPPDWHAKKRMILFCILLLIANLCVGTYLFLTWGKRTKRTPEPVPVQTPDKPDRVVVPPPGRPGDVG